MCRRRENAERSNEPDLIHHHSSAGDRTTTLDTMACSDHARVRIVVRMYCEHTWHFARSARVPFVVHSATDAILSHSCLPLLDCSFVPYLQNVLSPPLRSRVSCTTGTSVRCCTDDRTTGHRRSEQQRTAKQRASKRIDGMLTYSIVRLPHSSVSFCRYCCTDYW